MKNYNVITVAVGALMNSQENQNPTSFTWIWWNFYPATMLTLLVKHMWGMYGHWSTRPTHNQCRQWSLFTHMSSVCKSVPIFQNLAKQKFPNEGSDRYCQYCGPGCVDHWWHLACLFDPLGHPTVTAVGIIVFAHVVRPHFSNLAKQNKENNVRQWRDCESGCVDHWWHLSCTFSMSL